MKLRRAPPLCRWATQKEATLRRFSLIIGVISASLMVSGCGDSGSSKPSAPRKLDVIDDAFILCDAMKKNKLTTQCSVVGSDRRIDVTIDIDGAGARDICDGTVRMMAKHTNRFAGEWKLQIFSPYSGQRPIATCVLT